MLVEVDYFCDLIGPKAFPMLLEDIGRGAYEVENLIESDYVRVSQLMHQYSDLRVGFVDAAVLAIVERLRESKLATLDRRHFGVMRPAHTRTIDLLPA